MKLISVLNKLGSIEKNSFIKVIDNIISNDPKNHKEIQKILSSSDKGLKSVDNENIVQIFLLIQDEFQQYVKSEFQVISSQLDIIIDIIIRDGNCIVKQDWFSRLYENEIQSIKRKTKNLKNDLNQENSSLSKDRIRDYKIYEACLRTAYENDLQNNRDSRITEDEQSILITLSKRLGLSQEEIKLINYSIVPIEKNVIQDVVKDLKNLGLVFFSNKENTIYVADEVIKHLRAVRQKEVADKYFRRVLKLLRVPIINHVCRQHNIDSKLGNSEKIEEIIKEGVSFSDLLLEDIYKNENTLTEKKKTLNELCENGLNIQRLKGSTLEDKIESLIAYFDQIERDENVSISIDGYEKLLNDLDHTFSRLNKKIKDHFQFQEDYVLKASFLLDFNIKPRDVLDLMDNEAVKKFISTFDIKKRGDDLLNILDHYKDTENLLLENYVNIANRDLNSLKSNGIIIKESELGLQFEQITKLIFENIGFHVNENLRQTVNTKKDQVDILLDLGNDEVILVECKSLKEKGYNKFSSVTRQIKSYCKLLEGKKLRVVKVLLVAPDFTDDFITDCEMDVEVNLSLVTANTLNNINEAFKNSKYEIFPHVLFRDVLLNEKRIIKALSK